MKTIKDANLKLFKRYHSILNGSTLGKALNIAFNMCEYALNNDMLEDKQSRWLGFVQGVMFKDNLLNIKEERDISREYFHAVYKEQHIDIPESVDITD